MTSETLVLNLPYPPSVNTYWGFHGARRFLTKKAVEFKQFAASAFCLTRHKGFGMQRLSVTIYLFPPDKRVRDIDNCVKSLLDSLCQANVFVDDSQIDRLLVVRKEQKKGGECLVSIAPIACHTSEMTA
jgi:crossover junction endodeoxyribonuclease RusA